MATARHFHSFHWPTMGACAPLVSFAAVAGAVMVGLLLKK
jgi:hypothetical protein